MPMTRRDLVKIGGAVGTGFALGCRVPGGPAPVVTPVGVDLASNAVLRRIIPSSGEAIPVVGIGTARRYDVADDLVQRGPLADTLRAFRRLGGTVIDTAPSYGNAEPVVGALVEQLGIRDDLFLATKVGARTLEDATRQIGESFRRLRTEVIDLLQVHNLRGIEREYRTLVGLKEQGRIRYHGMTTSSGGQYDDFARHMRTKDFDFVQINYSILQRDAETELLPLAQDRGMAVLVNLPYSRGAPFDVVSGTPVPEWAAEWGISSWGQFFLKWILAHPTVTCVIPGTATVRYAEDNFGAARGGIPDAEGRARMTALFDTLR